MYFAPKEIKLKDGRTALLRSPLASDAAAGLAFMKQTAEETPFLLRSPEECTLTLEEEEKFLSRFPGDPNTLMILCFVDGALAGNCQLVRKTKIKNRHRASIGIAICREFWGLGIGSGFFRELIAQGHQWGLKQLELEVIEGNERAMGLYRKMGFEIVSHVPNAILMPDGSYAAEFLMIKPLEK